MTTPSAMRRLNKAAELYVQFVGTSMMLCHTIQHMNAKLVFDDDVPQETRDILEGVAKNQERAFKEQLHPIMERMFSLEKLIKENLPNPDKIIIIPGDN